MWLRLITWIADRFLDPRTDDGDPDNSRAAMPSLDWRALRKTLGADLDGFTLFVEMRDGALRPADALGLDPRDIVGLAAAWFADDSVSSEPHARALEQRLSARADITATLLMGRDIHLPFLGMHVRLHPRIEPDKRVLYRGRRVNPEWPARVDEAQRRREYVIGGRAYRRIRYGDENSSKELDAPVPEPCHDCAVLRGEYHVGPLCDMEECPRCGGQVIGCDCPYEGDPK
jgi:hypothetical protein